jgi:hypothetical protein
MKTMILRRNIRGRGIDVGWRFGDGPDARVYVWTTVRDGAALARLIADVRQVGEPFLPPTPAQIAAVTAVSAADSAAAAQSCAAD